LEVETDLIVFIEIVQGIRDFVALINFRVSISAFGVLTPMISRVWFGFISAARPAVFPKDWDIPVCIRSAPAPVSILFSRRMWCG